MNKSHYYYDLLVSVFRWFLVALVTIILFFPVLVYSVIISPIDPTRKHIHRIVAFWAKAIMFVCPLMNVRIYGQENLKPNGTYVLIANHQSITDIIAVLHFDHPFKFIAKHELFWIPFFGWSLSRCGYIPLVRGNPRSSKEAMRQASFYVSHGMTVIFFPEGTRSRDGEIQNFKVGAFKLAADAGVSIVPIVIDGTRSVVPKGSRVLNQKAEVVVHILKPHQVSRTDVASVDKNLNEVRSEMVECLQMIRSSRKGIQPASV